MDKVRSSLCSVTKEICCCFIFVRRSMNLTKLSCSLLRCAFTNFLNQRLHTYQWSKWDCMKEVRAYTPRCKKKEFNQELQNGNKRSTPSSRDNDKQWDNGSGQRSHRAATSVSIQWIRNAAKYNNWYSAPITERHLMMRDHGMIGRKYAGQVTQIISGSIGFDDWEWGVDLFADDPLVFKKLVYEMRFDEASAYIRPCLAPSTSGCVSWRKNLEHYWPERRQGSYRNNPHDSDAPEPSSVK